MRARRARHTRTRHPIRGERRFPAGLLVAGGGLVLVWMLWPSRAGAAVPEYEFGPGGGAGDGADGTPGSPFASFLKSLGMGVALQAAPIVLSGVAKTVAEKVGELGTWIGKAIAPAPVAAAANVGFGTTPALTAGELEFGQAAGIADLIAPAPVAESLSPTGEAAAEVIFSTGETPLPTPPGGGSLVQEVQGTVNDFVGSLTAAPGTLGESGAQAIITGSGGLSTPAGVPVAASDLAGMTGSEVGAAIASGALVTGSTGTLGIAGAQAAITGYGLTGVSAAELAGLTGSELGAAVASGSLGSTLPWTAWLGPASVPLAFVAPLIELITQDEGAIEDALAAAALERIQHLSPEDREHIVQNPWSYGADVWQAMENYPDPYLRSRWMQSITNSGEFAGRPGVSPAPPQYEIWQAAQVPPELAAQGITYEQLWWPDTGR